jgi:hypothetical protein
MISPPPGMNRHFEEIDESGYEGHIDLQQQKYYGAQSRVVAADLDNGSEKDLEGMTQRKKNRDNVAVLEA